MKWANLLKCGDIFLLLILQINTKYFGRILHLFLDTCSFPFIDIVHVAAEEAAVPVESFKSFVVHHSCSVIRNPPLYTGQPKVDSDPGKKIFGSPRQEQTG